MSLSVVVLHLDLTVEEVPSKSLTMLNLDYGCASRFKACKFEKISTTFIVYRDQILLGVIYFDQTFTLKYGNS